MEEKMLESQGRFKLFNLFSAIWLGDWELYEQIVQELPDEILTDIPFHAHYDKEQVSLWYENYFMIPDQYFVPLYFSHYVKSLKGDEAVKQDLLCLIGMYEEMGFYYPLEKEKYPDHIGCTTAFFTATIRAEIKAYQKQDHEDLLTLNKLQLKIYNDYIHPNLVGVLKGAKNKIQDPFFNEFISYFQDMLESEFQAVS